MPNEWTTLLGQLRQTYQHVFAMLRGLPTWGDETAIGGGMAIVVHCHLVDSPVQQARWLIGDCFDPANCSGSHNDARGGVIVRQASSPAWQSLHQCARQPCLSEVIGLIQGNSGIYIIIRNN
jgi:hypothetical protein